MPKKPRFASNSPFGGDDNQGENSWIKANQQIYSSSESSIFEDIAKADAQIERIKRVDIFEIAADPIQPRRTIPSVVRQNWHSNPEQLHTLFARWFQLIEDERSGIPFDLGAYLDSDPTERIGTPQTTDPSFLPEGGDYQPGILEAAFLKIVDLAASIRNYGLTNPISVVETDTGYQIETGERRWLAYHLLYNWFDGSDDNRPDERDIWRIIPTRAVPQFDVWRQASENSARADLNAIGRARQYALLMIDLLSENGDTFQPYGAFNHEREYYAQVAGNKVPYGKGEQLLNAMGINSRSALSRYRKILLLPDEIWQGGDDLNLPEELLYDLASMDQDAAIATYRQTVLGQNSSVSRSNSRQTNFKDYAPGSKRHFALMMQAIKKSGSGKSNQNTEALAAIRELRLWLDEQEAIISSYSD